MAFQGPARPSVSDVPGGNRSRLVTKERPRVRWLHCQPVAVGLLAAFVGGYTEAGSAGGPQLEFSADSLMQVNGMAVKERVYAAPGMLRRDLDVGRGHQIEITRWDKKVAWLLMTEDKLYLERPLTPADDRTPYTMALEQTAVAKEPLNGMTATKFRAMHRQSDGTILNGWVWTSPEGIVVKMDLRSDTVPPVTLQLDLTGLTVEKQEAGLFEVPPGYHRLSLGGNSP